MSKTWVKNVLILALVGLLVFSLAGCGGGTNSGSEENKSADNGKKEEVQDQPEKKENAFVSIGTGNQAGTWYIVMGGMTQIFDKYAPNIKWNVQATGASVENMRLVGTDQLELGLATPDVAYFAYKGIRDFEGQKFDNLRTVMGGNVMQWTMVVKADSDIKSFDDLKGKRIYTGTPGSATKVLATTILKVAGLEENKDYTSLSITLGDAVEAMRDGELDAIPHLAATPIPGFIDLSSTEKIRILPVVGDFQKKILEENPYWRSGKVPAGSYDGVDEDVETIDVGTVMMTSADMPDEVIYDIVKTIIENNQEAASAHKSATEFNAENSVGPDMLVPYHPGAKKYLEEAGHLK